MCLIVSPITHSDPPPPRAHVTGETTTLNTPAPFRPPTRPPPPFHASSRQQVNLTQSLTVRSLIIYGELLVTPPSPTPSSRRLRQPQALVINSAFILVRGKGAKLTVSGTTWDRRVTIYLRRCGCSSKKMGPLRLFARQKGSGAWRACTSIRLCSSY